MVSTVKFTKALDILRDYKGDNPYMLILQREVYAKQRADALGDFQIEFILRNAATKPVAVNRIVRLVDWMQEKKRADWNLDFNPEKILITSYLGDTQTTYVCYVQYRKSVPPALCFLPKKGVVGNFLSKDWHSFYVDFERYDRLSMARDPNRCLQEHQKEAVQFLLTNRRCILADDQGLGKSCSLSVASIEGNYDSVVIVCPASLKTNWKEELMWYVPERDITIIESFGSKNKSELESFLGYGVGKSGKSKDELLSEAQDRGKWADNRYVIVNYDILDEFYKNPSGRSKAAIEQAEADSPLLRFVKGKKSCLIIDEAHRLSNSTSIRYKVIKNLIKKGNPDSVFLATGTPITNNPQNLFCLLQLIDAPISADWNYYMERYCGSFKIPAKGEKERWTGIFLQKIGKRSFSDLSSAERETLKFFIREHARMINVPGNPTNLDELKGMVSDIYLRRVKEDIKGITKKTIHEVVYTLTAEQRAEYERLWDEYEKAQTEADPEKELNRDLLEGSIYRKYLSDAMVPYTERLADRLISEGEKVVIACCYDDELYALKDYYGERCVIYNGKMDSKQKDKAKSDFMTNPDVKVIIGNIIACGVGLTLTVACKLIFNDMSYVPAENIQMQDRICRIGQTRDCDIYYQIFKDTQYEHIWDIVMKKSYNINQVIKKEIEK